MISGDGGSPGTWLNGLYFNLAGRVKQEIVPAGQRREAVMENLREQLIAFRDPDNGRQVVRNVLSVDAPAENALTSSFCPRM